MELSEHLKLRLESSSAETQADRLSRSTDPTTASITGPSDSGPIDEAESQMRKALGLLGEPRNRPDTERMDQPARLSERFNGGLHRRRFVQDGDIPVTVLRRGEQGHEIPPHRGVAAAP